VQPSRVVTAKCMFLFGLEIKLLASACLFGMFVSARS